jgi:hypothetical protein
MLLELKWFIFPTIIILKNSNLAKYEV